MLRRFKRQQRSSSATSGEMKGVGRSSLLFGASWCEVYGTLGGSSHPSSAGGIEVVNPRQGVELETARRVASRVVAVSTMSVQGDWETRAFK